MAQDYKDEKQERWERAAKLAEEVIDECRVQLMLKFRFLDLALWRMPLEASRVNARYPLATDAKKVYFEPYMELSRFETSFNEAVRDYLHLVMHCIFRHPFDETHERDDAWWLAADVLTENVVMEMCGDRFDCEDDVARKELVSEITLAAGGFTPGKLYTFFEKVLKSPYGASVGGFSHSRLVTLQALFERDNHEAWPAYGDDENNEETPGETQELSEQSDDGEDGEPDESSAQLQTEAEVQASEDEGQQQAQDNDSGNESDEGQAQGGDDDADEASADSDGPSGMIDSTEEASDSQDGEEAPEHDERSEDEREWEDIAKQIEMNLDTFSKEWGDEAGSLIEALRLSNRKVYDYSDFLRRFTVISEEMKINEDEYDYIFYTYGMDLYGNMPLVEPLEYKDTQRVRDFAIVIDTSESVRGDLVRRFLEHTFQILKESEDFTSEVNIHIIQCDAKVQSDTKVSHLSEIDELMERFYIRGYGGTDFRPAFDYVDQLIDRGEFTDLKGLIYFTDGQGQFPEKVPDYDSAFVFMDTGEAQMPSVPPWAMRVVLDESGINRFKSTV